MKKIPILYLDDSVIVCEKPIGMPVQSDRSRDRDMITELKHRLFLEQESHEEPYLAAVHRLDRPVGGLMVLARTKDAAAHLSRQIREGLFEKNYQAVVCGALEEEAGTFSHYLLKDGRKNLARVVEKGTPGAKHALLDYELIDMIEWGNQILSWVLITLHTGRHHQIRAQFAAMGHPLYGDSRYGKTPALKNSGKKVCTTPGLYATRLSFLHPETEERMVFKTEPAGPAFEVMDVEAF